MKKKIEVSLFLIYELIVCAEIYGYTDDVLFDGFREMLEGHMDDDSIDAYAKSISKLDGYDEEDYEDIKGSLMNFKKDYLLKQK